MNKKIGTFLLSGIITGSMLGSGIIILPTLAYEKLGNYSFIAWLAIIFLGALYAKVFSTLNENFSNGLGSAVSFAFGNRFKVLTSYFLIIAVFAGPSVIMVTIGNYLNEIYTFTNSNIIYPLVFIILGILILTKNISSIGKISLVLSILISLVLLISSVNILFFYRQEIEFVSTPKLIDYGQTILMLFWAIVGWEVVGNYSKDIENPEKTLKKSVKISFILVNFIYFLTVLALQFADIEKILGTNNTTINLSLLLIPIFGKFGKNIMVFTAVALCMSTYILFVGSASRLMKELAEEKQILSIFSKTAKNNSPYLATIFLAIIHLANVYLISIGKLNLNILVSFANVFFILNALIGVLSAMKILKGKRNFLITSTLGSILCILLMFSSKYILLVPIILIIYTYYLDKKEKKLFVKKI